MYLVLYQGNNYYNRKIMREESHNDYITNRGFKQVAEVDGLSFIINDGITTSQIVNADADAAGFPDYAVLYDYAGGAPISRWWITECVITRQGQYRVEMVRDVIADWYDVVVSAPMFVMKGYPQSVNDPAIYNNETMTFNQIKQREYFIKDKTQCGWYVGYLSKEAKGEATKIQIPGNNVSVAEVYDEIDDYPYAQYTGGNPYIGDFSNVCYNMYSYVPRGVLYCAGFDDNGNRKTPTISGYQPQDWTPDGMVMRNDVNNPRGFSTQTSSGGNVLWDDTFWNLVAQNENWRDYAYIVTGAHNETSTANFINSQQGKIIQVGGFTKQIVVKETVISKTVDAANDSSFAQALYAVARDMGLSTTSGVQGHVSSITFTATGYYLDYTDISSSSEPKTYQIPDNRTSTVGVPYDVFAIPADSINTFGEPYYTVGSSPRLSQKVAAALTSQLVDGQVLYDIQYVPYCPLADEFLYEGVIDTNKLNQGATVDYSYIVPDENNSRDWTIIIYASSASFSKRLYNTRFYAKTNVEDFKVENECDMYRLCSPNYNGQFEFSVSKNGGVKGWNITFTYKPYTPYIKVSPIFGGLYGQDFGDARGLICGGDFSISQVEDEWKKYELNNKNYQVMFDRQIQNMEVNNSVQRELEKWNIGTGVAQGAGTGMLLGSSKGPKGMAIGAVAGGIASGVGGYFDRKYNEILRKEAVNYAQDQFGYQLQNIKALPHSLTKIGSQNEDYKVWPFVEKYTCTDTEKTALRDKLKWNGYTIERIGIITNFLKPADETFIQTRVIRLDALGEDSHVADFINTELQIGVYFT